MTKSYGVRGSSALAVVLSLLLLPAVSVAQEAGSVEGIVVDGQSQQPLTSVQVAIPGLSLGTVTNAQGRFTISDVAPGAHTVQFSFLGYGTQEREVTVSAGEAAELNVELTRQALDLDALVVTGTAVESRRREVGTSMATMSAEDIQMQTPAPRGVEDILQGSVPGLSLISSDGMAGSGGTIRIRGITSMSQSNRPLIYVDGVRIFSDQVPEGSGTSSSQAANPLNSLNPSDIESVEVVKGAAATTLYGTEAAGGVIQIRTRRGRDGPAQWSASVTQGVAQMPTFRHSAPSDLSPAWIDQFGEESAEWWMRPFLRDAHQQTYDLSVSGGSGDISYFLSTNFEDQKGVVETQGMRSFRVRGNIGFVPFDGLNVQFNNSYTDTGIDWIVSGNSAKGFTINVMRGPRGYGLVPGEFHRMLEDFDVREEIRHHTSGLEMRFQPTERWTSRLALGVDHIEQDHVSLEYFGSHFDVDGVAATTQFRSLSRTVDLATTYRMSLGDFSTSTAVGFQVFDNERVRLVGESNSFPGPSIPTVSTGAVRDASESRLREINAGIFLQETVGWQDRFFVTGGIRMDGNSSFGEDFGLQVYPKIDGAWNISDEGFWPTDLIETARIRAAFGESGQAPGYFDATRVWDAVSGAGGRPAVVPGNVGNPELGPERSRELEFGTEFSALRGRLNVDVTHYRQQTVDALVGVAQDPSQGFGGSQLLNVGKLQNIGTEVDVETIPYRSRSLEWMFGVTYSANESKALDLGDTDRVFPTQSGTAASNMWVRVGYPVPSHFGQKLLNPDEYAPPQYEEDAFLGPQYPENQLFVRSSLDIGDRLSLSARGEYAGHHLLNASMTRRQIDRDLWPPCFDIQQGINAGRVDEYTARERALCNYMDGERALPFVTDASFFKIRSASINYRVPEGFMGLPGNWSATFSGQNLLTFTDCECIDPETRDSTGGDGTDQLAASDYYNLPQPRRFTFTVRTTF